MISRENHIPNNFSDKMEMKIVIYCAKFNRLIFLNSELID